MNVSRLVVLALGALALLVFFALDLNRFFSLAYVQASQALMVQTYAADPWGTRAAFFATYVIVASLSLPGAVILILAAGGVFGFGWGLLLVSFASSIGATVSFLAARFALRDMVQARLGARLADINHGLRRDGGMYLLSLRLIPVVPFFLVNLLMGLTPLRTGTFYLFSQLGMLPSTAVYVNAGQELASITSLGDVASPGILAALAMLGVLPLVAHALASRFRKRPKAGC